MAAEDNSQEEVSPVRVDQAVPDVTVEVLPGATMVYPDNPDDPDSGTSEYLEGQTLSVPGPQAMNLAMLGYVKIVG